MTSDHDDDADLAPVTDLFGARSRRRTASVPDPGNQPPVPILGRADRDDSADADADTPVPLPIQGARAQAEWLSPVVGDDPARDTRAEHGNDDGGDGDGDGDVQHTDADADVGASTASVFAIGSGEEIDPADAPRPIDEQRADAERLSMRALGRKGVSTSELRTMLAKNDLDAEVVEYEIDRLVRVGLLDDVALATDLVDRLHDRKGLGRQGVVAELRRRGIDQAAIDAALDAAADDEDDEFVRAIELAQKRAGQLRGLDRATAERRLSGFLMRKGYNGGVVRIAVERALDGGGRPTGGPRGSVRFE